MAYSVTEDYYRIRWAGSAALHGESCLYTRARFEKPAEEVEELVLLSWGEASPFLGDIPSQQLQQETVPLKERPAEQLSLF